jgi:hypothetical protein
MVLPKSPGTVNENCLEVSQNYFQKMFCLKIYGHKKGLPKEASFVTPRVLALPDQQL